MKFKSFFVCQNCGYKSVSQLGKCPECGTWGSLVEEVEQVLNAAEKKTRGRESSSRQPTSISKLKQEVFQRLSTGFSEVDRALGGGLVLGSVVLLAGEPGVGKSTLLLQIAKKLEEKKTADKVLYVSGEESESQLALRYQRLPGLNKPKGEILILNEVDVDQIIIHLKTIKPDLLIVDSVQTLFTQDLIGVAGSVGQVRECGFRLSQACKEQGTPLFLVGQITKEGTIAGPKVLEHLVDVVLYFEGEKFQNSRILRTVKNRFGSVDEAGIFEMGDAGLVEIANPSEIFLGEWGSGQEKKGRVVTCVLEGTRPILAEIQALTVFSPLPQPRRVFSGLNFNRCQVVLAVCQKFLNLELAKFDVYLSVSGGLKIEEPAADLAVLLAVYSAVKDKKVPDVAFGEVGLLGDVRRVNNQILRLKEIKRLGFSRVASPDNFKNIMDILHQNTT